MGGMKHMHTIARPGLVCAIVAAASLYSTEASAAGVDAGTSIQNTATATYSNGATTETVTSNQVDILVDELLNVTVGSLDAGNVTLGSAGAVLSFELTNTGNGPEAFDLTTNAALSGDDFDPAVTLIAYDSNGSGAYEAGVDTTIAPGASTPSIAADDTLLIFVVTGLAGSPDDGDTGDVRLTAIAGTVTGSKTPGTVYAGDGEGGGDAVVGASGAEDEDEGTLVASIGAVSLAKSVAIADPFGGTEAVPGATATYTLTATVSGSGSVSGLTVTDPIPAGTTYQPGTLELDGAGLTDATGDDDGEAGSSGISVDLGAMASGASRTVTFSVTLN
jgi:uncharacterized repeat protein (TIGR01451 family)